MHKCSICKETMTYETKKVEGKWQGAWFCEKHGFSKVYLPFEEKRKMIQNTIFTENMKNFNRIKLPWGDNND